MTSLPSPPVRPFGSVEVVCVGDELLSGHIRDTNATWLGVHLAEVGVRLSRVSVVGDDIDAIVSAVAAAAERASLVVVTGGLGPTSDDITRDALAVLLGDGMTRDETVVAALVERAQARGRELHPDSLRMADVPVGATVLTNPAGSAPALALRVGNCEIVAMPGVPSEAEACARLHVLPKVAAAGAGAVATRSLIVPLVGETRVAQVLAPVALPGGCRLAFLPAASQVEVRLSIGSATAEQAGALLDRVVVEYQAALAAVDIVADDLPPAASLLRMLTGRGQTVAVAESLTGGALTAALVDVPGASAVVRGAVVAYATELKAQLLGVDADLLAQRGPVDGDIAVAMAEGVRRRCGSTWALATTGVAGPEPQAGHPVGEVRLGIVGPAISRAVELRLSGSRALIRELTVVHAMVELGRDITRSPR